MEGEGKEGGAGGEQVGDGGLGEGTKAAGVIELGKEPGGWGEGFRVWGSGKMRRGRLVKLLQSKLVEEDMGGGGGGGIADGHVG